MIIIAHIRARALKRTRPDVPPFRAIVKTVRTILGNAIVLLELEDGSPKTITLGLHEFERWEADTLHGQRLYDEAQRILNGPFTRSQDHAFARRDARRTWEHWMNGEG